MKAPSARRRRTYAALVFATVLAAVAAACKDDNPTGQCYNQRFDISRPTNAKLLAYSLDPSSIEYHYLDVRTDTMELTWDTHSAYYGGACLRFQTTDSVRIDSSGIFQFFLTGSNGAYLRRRLVERDRITNDSVLGYVFRGCEGDGGRFRLLPDSTISFTWDNGEQARILDPSAVHRLEGDVIRSSVTQSANADSVRWSWRLSWRRAYCGEGL